MKKILIFLLILLIGFNSYSQKNDNEVIISNIKSHVHDYLILQEIIEEDLDESNRASIIITEVLQKKIIGYNDSGVYIIGAHVSHTPSFILLKKGNKIRILDPLNVSKSLNVINKFLSDNFTLEEVKTNYLKRFIDNQHNNFNHSIKQVDYNYCWKNMR